MSKSNLESNITIIQKTPKDKKWLKKMYYFQQNLYKDNPHFVSHLKMESIGGFGQKGMLQQENPFHKKAEVAYFIAMRGRKIVGTISGTINHFHNDFHKESMGFFGCFEVIEDYAVAKTLLDTAGAWLKERKATKIRGPVTLDINGESGLLMNAYDLDPIFQTAYNFEYYKLFIEKYGFSKAKDLYAQNMPIILSDKVAHEKRNKRISKVYEFVQKRFPQIRVEYFNFKNPAKHLSDMNYLFKESWCHNWGYVPILEEEFESMADALRIIADHKLVMINYIDDKPAAFIVTIPDMNIELKKNKWLPQIIRLLIGIIKVKFHKIKGLRLILFGVLPEYRKLGLDAWLFSKSLEHAIEVGYKTCELSWLLEDNTAVLRAGEKMGAKVYKTWRIFEKNL